MRLNQEIDGGRWNLLGTYEMVPGANHRVVLSDDADEYVIADAVMFVPDTTSRVVAADAIRLVANSAKDPLFVHADHLGTPVMGTVYLTPGSLPLTGVGCEKG